MYGLYFQSSPLQTAFFEHARCKGRRLENTHLLFDIRKYFPGRPPALLLFGILASATQCHKDLRPCLDSWLRHITIQQTTNMLLSRAVLWGTLSTLATTVFGYTPASTIETDALAIIGLVKLGLYEAENGAWGNGSTCNLANVALRKEW
jgi:hypothetical protein